MTAPHTTLVIPKKPCSDKCVFHLDKRELEISDTQDKPRTPFSKDRLSALLSHLPGLEQQGKSYCDAAEVLSGPTCQDVSTYNTVFGIEVNLISGGIRVESMEDQNHAARGFETYLGRYWRDSPTCSRYCKKCRHSTRSVVSICRWYVR